MRIKNPTLRDNNYVQLLGDLKTDKLFIDKVITTIHYIKHT